MVSVQINDNESIDKMLKRFKKKYERAGVLKEYRKKAYFVKPSVDNRLKRSRSKRRAQRANEERNS
ncbi:30S ribosomal protein S21 [Prosthecochloris sp. N3]|uniref:Small ribosomal subunit protein bS21 n=1 Tax=Prosthecochloris ethylica TaxID=2743976 RepID=A0ABR9XNR5_9CHLB|nr:MULTISPECIES: 30S ribosomal protein S21 [Prosthecochloris]MEC9486538.1 30S ribosomal protein S21 [Prosthecochloris sp.]MBF0585761.1 30S ribosomal protein S21 [Prosthecochloris ethylica]MBF0635671.1 30S ribosomal protein S21 [Prosthecochloris ethylica]NUK46970.1 30S ribosomal protein S21 [Prosthecochloris ethylica]RNA65460.1 30S ribosomal protein S21 [Prosthecochloris sp. ZM_2]